MQDKAEIKKISKNKSATKVSKCQGTEQRGNDQTMNALKILQELDYTAKVNKYLNVPPSSIPKTKFSDKTTVGLTTAILSFLKLSGWFASRMDSKGTYSQHLGRFIPSNQRKGLPDIYAQGTVNWKPITLWVEVKCAATMDRLKPHQAEVIEELRKSGAIVCIAETFQGFYEWFTKEIKNKP